MPKVIFDAMIALAWQWSWRRWAALSLLAFHGKLRISEPLNAQRQHLLLPTETGSECPSAFLHIEKSKTSYRGKGVIQHTRISDDLALCAATRVFGPLAPTEFLYPATPSTYRRRWDKLLLALRIETSWRLTPGTLRAGGAIYAYHLGAPVTELLWLMRLKNLTALESYLQSTAAINLLLKLPQSVRHRVVFLARLTPFLVRHSPE